MKNKIDNFITAFQAEHIKKRGTGFYWTSAFIGMLSPFLFGIIAIITDSDEIKKGIPINYVLSFIQNSMLPFANFFFPLLIIITVSRITQLDHRNGGWQLMETQPLQKFSIYFSKFSTVLVANLIAILSFFVFSVLIALLTSYFVTVPKNATMTLPIAEIASLASRAFVASLFITAFQFVLCVLIPSFIWTIIIGFFGLLLTAFLAPFQLVPAWYPFEILGRVANSQDGSDLGYWFTFTEYASVIFSVILLYIGFQWYKDKQFKTAFLSKGHKIVAVLAVLVVFGGLLYWIFRPNQMGLHNRTVITGKIDSDEKFKKAYVVDFIIQDTIAIIPIKDNIFHFNFKNPVINDYYRILFDGKYKKDVYFGEKDSLYIDAKIYERADSYKITGTRLAENQINPQTPFDWSMAEFHLQENIDLDKPEKIAKAIYEEWSDATAAQSKFRTIDNYIAKNDFSERSKKLITVKHLNLWNMLVKKRAALFPNEKTVETKNIKEIKSSLSLRDDSLLSAPEYFSYVSSQLIANDKSEIDDNSKTLRAINKLNSGSFKDKMLFYQLKKSVEETSNTEERTTLLADNNRNFNNASYSKRIVAINKMVESLGKGKVAPAFAANSVDGKQTQLSDLKGKFVLIDVWATWCGPCKQQSPFFEKFAIKYKNENIQFVALSTDENISDWFVEAKSKSKNVLQLHANDPNGFGEDYNVESIPRFILIAPDGKFVNARLPFPAEASFEILLRKEMNLPEEQ